jgi:Golgin subfamily A member 7/ERF4 family
VSEAKASAPVPAYAASWRRPRFSGPTTPNPNLPPTHHILLFITSTLTTASSTQDTPQVLSPRALEKQPVRDRDTAFDFGTGTGVRTDESAGAVSGVGVDPVAIEDSQLQNLAPGLQPTREPPAQSSPPPSVTQIQQQSTKRRSFLESLLARQQRKGPFRDNRSPSQRILNPINHIPRPTPVEIDRHQVYRPGEQPGTGEVHTLLSLPEQRRSRQYSPTSPIVEHSPQLSSAGGSRTSVALPPNQRRHSQLGSQSNLPSPMGESEKPPQSRGRDPEKAVIPTSRFNPSQHDRDLDLEAQQEPQQGPSILGSTYGVEPSDQPLHPPRRVASHKSLRHIQSSNSLRSSQFQQQRSPNHAVPPLPPGVIPFGTPNNDPEDDNVAEELAWGPAHPCFPHLNPHVPKDSSDYALTRVIRIKRDWMVVGDLAPTFSNIYPEILDPLISEHDFRLLIQHINSTLVQAYDPFAVSSWLDGMLGFVTGWFWEDFRQSGIKGKLKELDAWIDNWNRNEGAREGVRITSLRRTGYMNIDIVIPDPQVRVVGEDDGRFRHDGPYTQSNGPDSAPGTAGTGVKAG